MTSMSQQQCIEQITSISPTTLVDVNWSVRLVASSSTFASLNEPRVLVQFRLLDKTAQQQQEIDGNEAPAQSQLITVELDRSELNEFVRKLQQARATMFALSK